MMESLLWRSTTLESTVGLLNKTSQCDRVHCEKPCIADLYNKHLMFDDLTNEDSLTIQLRNKDILTAYVHNIGFLRCGRKQ